MPSSTPRSAVPAILLVGASRGLGLAMAEEFADRGWRVVATVRDGACTELHDLADRHPGRIAIECLDITQPDRIAALRERLDGRRFDILFHNAGIANGERGQSAAQLSTDAFVDIMATNALAPLRIVEAMQDLVQTDGVIGVMSSGQGSIANNDKGGADAYRASKAALNQLMRCYAARHVGEPRALVLMAPGWIRTALGGPDAPFSIEETIPGIVDVLIAQRGGRGLRYLDRWGRDVAW